MIKKYLEQSVLFPKGLNWVEHILITRASDLMSAPDPRELFFLLACAKEKSSGVDMVEIGYNIDSRFGLLFIFLQNVV